MKDSNGDNISRIVTTVLVVLGLLAKILKVNSKSLTFDFRLFSVTIARGRPLVVDDIRGKIIYYGGKPDQQKAEGTNKGS